MPLKKRRSPQEKKELSYELDRRNCYSANDKASRKAIPARKAGENRKSRRKANHALTVVDRLADEQADVVESSLINDMERVGGWKKGPDQSLREHIVRQVGRSERRKNRRS